MCMHIGSYYALVAISLGQGITRSSSLDSIDAVDLWSKVLKLGVAKLMTSESQAGGTQNRWTSCLNLHIPESLQPVLHHGFARNEPYHRMAGSIEGANGRREVHESSAFGIDWPAGICKGPNSLAHRLVCRKGIGVELRIASAQIQPIDIREIDISDRREWDQMSPKVLKLPKVIFVIKVECRIARDANPADGFGLLLAEVGIFSVFESWSRRCHLDDSVQVKPFRYALAPFRKNIVFDPRMACGMKAQVSFRKTQRGRYR